MTRLLKWSAGILAGIIILAVIAVVVVIYNTDFNSFKTKLSQAVYDATGRELIINSDVDVGIGLSPSLVMSDINFMNADWGTRKEMVKVGRFEVKVSLLPLIKGNIEVNRFILKDPDILIETDKNGNTNLEFKPGDKTAAVKKEPSERESKPSDKGNKKVALPGVIINQFEIVNGTLTYRDGKTGKTEVVKLNHLTADIKGLDNPLNFDLSGAYNDYPFEVKGVIGSIKGINDPSMEWPLDISVNAFGVSSEIKGAIKDPLEQKGINIDFNLKIDDWNSLSELAGQDLPVKDAFSVSCSVVDNSIKSYQVKDLEIVLGKSRIDGYIALNLAGKVPAVDASLSSNELDLRPFMPEDKASEKKPEVNKEKAPAKGNSKIFPSDPLPLDSLKLVDGNFKIRFDKIIMPQTVISNFVTDTSLKNGALTVKPFKADMGGGSIKLEMALKPKGKRADLYTVMNIKGVEISDVLAEAGVAESAEGAVDADIDIKGSGDSVASIMAGLKGYLRFIMNDGRISNKFIDELDAEYSKGIFRLLNPAKEKKEYTAVRCMVIRLDMVNGIADTTAFVFDTSVMSVIGNGDINLKSETLDISLDPTTKGEVAGYDLKLGELTQPFKLGGTLSEPSLKVDKAKTITSIGKALGVKAFSDDSGKEKTAPEKGKEVSVCAAALKAAETGVRMTAKKGSQSGSDSSEITTEKLINDVIEDPEKALNNLFGK